MYQSILRLSRSRGPVCRRLPIFVAIVVLQARSPTQIHTYMSINVRVRQKRYSPSLSYVYICMIVCMHVHVEMPAYSCRRNCIVFVARKTWIVVVFVCFFFCFLLFNRPLLNWFNSFVIVIGFRVFVHVYTCTEYIFGSVAAQNSFIQKGR